MKVEVFDGAGEDFLGFGNLVGNVTVYAIAKPDGSIVSCENAEERPPDEVIAKHDGELITIEDNPKIVLDIFCSFILQNRFHPRLRRTRNNLLARG